MAANAENNAANTATAPQPTPTISQLAQRLVQQNAKALFVDNCDAIFSDWVSLLHKSTLPSNIICDDSRVAAAFDAIHSIIDNDANPRPLILLAYVRLSQIMAALQKIVSVNRRNGRISGRAGQRNASVAVDIYLGARRLPASSRNFVHKRVRFAHRWAALGGSSPLLLIIYPAFADTIVYPRSPHLLHLTSWY